MRTEMREREAEDQFMAWMDEVYGEVNICGYKYGAAYALITRVDPIAYRQEFLNWADSEEIDLI